MRAPRDRGTISATGVTYTHCMGSRATVAPVVRDSSRGTMSTSRTGHGVHPLFR
jgi:hypothetical protein